MKKLSILWVLIILFGYFTVCFSCVEKERIGLLKLLGYPPSSWVDYENSDCCGWESVVYDNNTRRVIRLGIYPRENVSFGNRVLDASLFVPFQQLQYLDLHSHGFFTLQNDQDLGRLKKLEVLKLSYNYFNNTLIFQSLSTLTSLTVLDLFYNKINGSFSDIGRELCKLKNLNELYLGFNHLSGFIPACFSNLTSLKALDLSHNNLVGNLDPSLLVTLTKLEYFSLSANLQLDGNLMFNSLVGSHRESQFKYLGLFNCNINISTTDLAKFLHNQSNLILFDLSHNKLHGEFSNLLFENNSRLKSLNLQNNSLTGNILFPVGPLVNLEWLQVSHNHIQGELQSNIGEVLPKLRQLLIANNVLRGGIPISILNMKNLTKLDLSNNNLSGKLPERLDLSYKRLKLIQLSNNRLEGQIPDTLFNLPELFILDLSNNQFTGHIPNNSFRYCKLSLFDISRNYISGRIPRSLGNLKYYPYTIDMHGNSIEGYIPPELCDLTSIKSLDLSENQLSGDMPSCLITLPKLTSLHLQHNKLTLPKTLPVNTSGLLALDLSHNNLSHNMFTGVIPPSLSNMKQIESIDFSHNKLSGDIPSSLTRLYFLVIFSVAYNNLSGRVPEMVAQFSTFDETSYEGNPFLCGPPLLRKHCKINADQVPITDTLAGRNDLFGIDPISFLASFAATYVTCLLGFVIVLCINPYWRRRWFHFIDTCLSFVFPSWY